MIEAGDAVESSRTVKDVGQAGTERRDAEGDGEEQVGGKGAAVAGEGSKRVEGAAMVAGHAASDYARRAAHASNPSKIVPTGKKGEQANVRVALEDS